MATNRLYIVCDGCKSFRYLDRLNPGCSLNIDQGGMSAMNDFFERHEDCSGHDPTKVKSLGFSFACEDTVYANNNYQEDCIVR